MDTWEHLFTFTMCLKMNETQKWAWQKSFQFWVNIFCNQVFVSASS
jgi:hypothetical protein